MGNIFDKETQPKKSKDLFGITPERVKEELVREFNQDGWYEPDDIGCECNDFGNDSDWRWNNRDNQYVCSGCGAIQ